MGLYIYRITIHTVEVILPSGKRAQANVAAFGYKPSWTSDEYTRKAARSAARRIPSGRPLKYFVCGEADGTVSPNETVYENPKRLINLPDDLFGSAPFPVASVRVAPTSSNLPEGDALVQELTACAKTLDELLDQWVDHHYRPSLDVREPARARLADLYDARAKQRGIDVQAYRYGVR